METLEKHFTNILRIVQDLEARGRWLEQHISGDRQTNEMGTYIKQRCMEIKAEVQRIEQLDEQFRSNVNVLFKTH